MSSSRTKKHYYIELHLECEKNKGDLWDTDFMTPIYPKWSLAIKMLNDKPLNEYNLQPLGKYIGSRQIFKLAGKKMSIDEIF